MKKRKAYDSLEKFIRKLSFQKHESFEKSVDTVGAHNKTVLLKCNGYALDQFTEHLYDLITDVSSEELSNLKSSFFDGTEFLGVVLHSKNVKQLAPEIHDSIDILGFNPEVTDTEESFLSVIRKVLQIDHLETDSNNHVCSNQPKLKWNGTGRELGFIIRYLVDERLIEPPLRSSEVNCNQLATQVLNGFDLNSKHQNVRKQLDPDQNSLDESSKFNFREELNKIIKSANE